MENHGSAFSGICAHLRNLRLIFPATHAARQRRFQQNRRERLRDLLKCAGPG